MSYNQFTREEILQKAKDRYFKKEAVEHYLKNKEAIKEKSKRRCKSLTEEQKDKIKEYQRKTYQQLIKVIKQLINKMKYCKANKFYFTKYKNEKNIKI